MRPLAVVEGLVVTYGEREVLKGVSLKLLPGRITALVGTNGFGKTTLLRALFGEISWQSGSVSLCDLDPAIFEDRRRLWQHARWIGDTPVLYDELTIREFLGFSARSYGVPEPQVATIIEDRAMNLGLTAHLDERIGTLSFGTKRKVHVASGFFSGTSGPRVLALDEPTAGLDPPSRQLLAQALRQYVGGDSERAILFSSHHLDELNQIADDVVVLDGGTKIEDGPIGELDAARDTALRYELTLFDARAEELVGAIPADLGVDCWVIDARRVALTCPDADAVQALLRVASGAKTPFRVRELREDLSPLARVFVGSLGRAGT